MSIYTNAMSAFDLNTYGRITIFTYENHNNCFCYQFQIKINKYNRKMRSFVQMCVLKKGGSGDVQKVIFLRHCLFFIKTPFDDVIVGKTHFNKLFSNVY